MKWSPQSPSHTSECAFSKTFHPEYHYCMKSKLPPTEIITINPDTLPSYQPEKEEVTRPISSYIMSCFGDSGAGQFISNGVNLKEFYPGDKFVDWIGVSIFQQVYPWSSNWANGYVNWGGDESDIDEVLSFAKVHNKVRTPKQ